MIKVLLRKTVGSICALFREGAPRRAAKRWLTTLAAAIAAASVSTPSLASDGGAGADFSAVNNAWVMLAAILVIMMISPGITLFYGGLVRAKNLVSIAAQVLNVAALVFIGWFLFGYAIAFVGDGAVIGNIGTILASVSAVSGLSGDIPETTFMLFQGAFAALATCLVIGAVAERVRFAPVMLFALLWSLVVYAPICHWIWGGGFLAGYDIIEFAGGLVVHGASGVSALVFALMVGQRKGFGREGIRPGSPVYVALGAAFLWAGWFGFNGGSALAADDSAARAMLVTQLAACSGALAWTLIESRQGKPSLIGACSGAIAGLVMITPAAGVAGPLGAVIVGALASPIAYYTIRMVRGRLKIDDSLDVFGIHGIVGIVGTIMAAVVAAPFMGGGGFIGDHTLSSQLGAQVMAAAVSMAYAAVATALIVYVVSRVMGGFRVDEEDEARGLDISCHGEEASQ